MKSKLLKLMLILGIVSVIFTLPQIADAATEGNYTYSVSNGEATITDFPTSVSGAITIPDTLGGHPVTSIGYGAFEDCSSLTSITIPEGVTSIGEDAFYNCSSLTSITIPDSVKSIGSYAFYGCSSLTSIIIPDSITRMGYNTFYGCNSLKKITLPFVGASRGANETFDAVFGYIFGYTSSSDSGTTRQYYKSSSSYYYYIPTSLKEVIITDATQISYGAFYNCSNLTSITISDSVKSIGSCAFYNCSSLEKITLPFVGASRGTNETFDAVFGYIFGHTLSPVPGTTKQNYDNSSSYYYYIPTSLKEVIITDATQIPYGAFYYCSSLTSITIPDGVKSIGDSAFYYCSSLTSITIPDGVKSIGDSAFYYCSSLTSIMILDGVKSIGDSAFYNCSSLTSITIPDSVTSIGNGAFKNCSSLEKITLPFVGSSRYANETYDAVFGYIFGYTSSSYWKETEQYYKSDSSYHYYIPTSLKEVIITDTIQIPYGAFYNCSNLTSIMIPDGVTSIDELAFYNTVYYNDESNWADGVLYFYNHLIDAKTDISGEYKIRKGTKSIASSAFSGCSSLTSITIPDSITSIGSSAFYNCSSLTSITIPDSVTSIGNGAFENCSSLEKITLPFVGSSRYANETYDAVFGYIFGYTSSSSSGTTRQYYGSRSYYYYIPASLKEVIITDAIQIPYGAFYGCSSLMSITIPDGVMSIGSYAFYNCSSLTSITIPDSVTSIGDRAFSGCNELAGENGLVIVCNIIYDYFGNGWNVIIPDSVTSIGDSAFEYCRSLTSITIPDSVTSIGDSAFYNCSSLTSITIPDSVTSIGEYAFYDCSSLEKITLPFVGSSRYANETYDAVFGYIFGYTSSSSSGTTQQYYEEYNSDYYYIPSSLKEVIITDATQIPYGAFYNCSRLTSITIPDSVTSIGEEAFYKCSALDKVYISDVGAYLNCEYGDTYSVPMYYANKLYLNGKRVVSLTIPDTVTKIPSYAFEGCDSLRRVIIPDSVTTIGNNAFKGCTSIESITVPFVGSSREASGTSDAVFGYLFGYSTSSATGTTRQYFSASGSNYYYIPSGLKTVIITDTEQIPYGAFYGCDKLTDIQLADSVKTIGEKAFYNCDGITEFVITKNVSATGQQAFYSCGSLERVVIPRSLTEIEVNAFEACNSITTVDYQGSEDEWWEMYIGSGNDAIEDASVTCNYGMPVSITYASNGGANAPANQQAEENSDYTVSSVIPERSGYTFLGWADSPDSDAALYAPGDVIKTGTENITLYAVWKKHISLSTEFINNTFVITPVGLENGNSIVLACYCGEKMVYADVFSYAGSSVVPFFVSAEYDTVKVMALESMSSIRPICKSDTAVSPANEISLLMIE